jgi:hypothetical protein
MKSIRIRFGKIFRSYEVCSNGCGVRFAGFFLQFRNRIAEIYDGFFTRIEDGGQNNYSAAYQFSQRWGWYQSIYAIAGGDLLKFESVTKLTLHQCLTWLSFEKEKIAIENKQLNDIQRNR